MLGESQPRRNIWARGAYHREGGIAADALPPAFGSGRMRRRMPHCRSDPLDVQCAGVNGRKSGAFSRAGSINSNYEKRALWAIQRKLGAHRRLGFGWPATHGDGMPAVGAIFIRIVGLTKMVVS